MIQSTQFMAHLINQIDDDVRVSIEQSADELPGDEDDIAAELDRPRETRVAFLVLTQCAGRLNWD